MEALQYQNNHRKVVIGLILDFAMHVRIRSGISVEDTENQPKGGFLLLYLDIADAPESPWTKKHNKHITTYVSVEFTPCEKGISQYGLYFL